MRTDRLLTPTLVAWIASVSIIVIGGGSVGQDAGLKPSANRPGKEVALHFHDVPIVEVFRFIQSATEEPGRRGMIFAAEIVGPSKVESLGGHHVTIDVDNQSLEVSLGRLLDPLQLRFDGMRDLVWISSKAGLSPRNESSKRREEQTRTSLDEVIPLHFDDAPVEDVLGFIRSATAGPGYDGMRFATEITGPGSLEAFRGRRVTIHAEGRPLRESLDRLLGPLRLHFEALDGLIVVTGKRGERGARPRKSL